jgi:hypothetical protein
LGSRAFQQGGLAAARRAQQFYEFAAAHLQADIAQRMHRRFAAAMGLAHRPDEQHRLFRRLRVRSGHGPAFTAPRSSLIRAMLFSEFPATDLLALAFLKESSFLNFAVWL